MCTTNAKMGTRDFALVGYADATRRAARPGFLRWWVMQTARGPQNPFFPKS